MDSLKRIVMDIVKEPLLPRDKKPADKAPKKARTANVFVENRPFCDPDSRRPCITVCAPKGECACNCSALEEALIHEIADSGLPITLGAMKVGCAGSCGNGPIVGFPQKGFFYFNVTLESAREIVQETLLKGRILFPYLSIGPDRSFRPDVYFDKDTGTIAGIDGNVCMVEVAKYFLDFENMVSCGKCVPCRIGIRRLYEAVVKISVALGTMEDLEYIRSLCETLRDAPNCDFAKAASKPAFSAVTFFEDEFRAHVEGRKCRAGACDMSGKAPEILRLSAAPPVEKAVGEKPEKAAGKETTAPAPVEESKAEASPPATDSIEASPPPDASLSVVSEPEPVSVEPTAEPPVSEAPVDVAPPAREIDGTVEEPSTKEESVEAEASFPKECVLRDDLPEAELQASAMAVPAPRVCEAPPEAKPEEKPSSDRAPSGKGKGAKKKKGGSKSKSSKKR